MGESSQPTSLLDVTGTCVECKRVMQLVQGLLPPHRRHECLPGMTLEGRIVCRGTWREPVEVSHPEYFRAGGPADEFNISPGTVWR